MLRFFFFVSLFTSCLLFLSVFAQDNHIFLPSDDEPGCPAPNPNLYYRPVIGILSHPGDGASGRLSNASGISNIPASYIKFVEAGGARVIPLIYNESSETLAKKLNLVNGVLFTGGWSKTGLYFDTVKYIFEKALEKNDAGDYFPTIAFNLGSELIVMIVSEDNGILEKFSASSMPSTLELSVGPPNIEGSLFQSFAPDLLMKSQKECLVMHNHQYSISPEKLLSNAKLSSFFEILTTTKDRDNKAFVSTARARNYPVTIVQWNPEKNAFEWASSAKYPHTEDAIRVTQSTTNFFVSEARKSSNRPDDQEVRDNLIYNYNPTYGGKAGKGYDQVYLFE